MIDILLAEDDDAMRQYLTRALERAGYCVVAVDRGTDALAHIMSGEAFDLLLTDIVMPEMDGIELAQRVATNAPLTNYALMHALPRIAEQPADHGLFTEALMSAIAQAAPEAKERVRAFLEGRANKVQKG